MKKIEHIESEILLIQPKLEIKATDWTKSEKEAIAKAYFEITKVSVGKGRNLDLGCTSCIATATAIINNYLLATASSEVVMGPIDFEEEDVVSTEIKPSNSKWRKNSSSVDEAAEELGLEFPEDCVSKKERIQFVELNLEELNK